ncbi:hypothetical protein MUP77_06910 [Candidatus Bathyarchaeota archaeon]|nr:hypothetical protein [Candidatus Bathyarchaeota archaeon]
MNFKANRLMTTRTGLLILGVLWLIFWLGPAFHLFEADSRWAHNFALAMVFITVGSASNFQKISCELVAVIASFLTIPTFLGYISGINATYIAAALLISNLLLYLMERRRKIEILNPAPRLKAWLKIHQLTFAYLGLAHMPLIFFFIRWYNPLEFYGYLPLEHEISTSSFNLMLLPFTVFGIMERYVRKIGKLQVSLIGFTWSMLMIVVPMMSIVLLGQ